jgi:hypothetical protein
MFGFQPIQDMNRIRVDNNRRHGAFGDESFLDGKSERIQQAIEVALNINNSDRLAHDADLPPRYDFAKFIERAEAAGKRDKGIG